VALFLGAEGYISSLLIFPTFQEKKFNKNNINIYAAYEHIM